MRVMAAEPRIQHARDKSQFAERIQLNLAQNSIMLQRFCFPPMATARPEFRQARLDI
jgi:hypothetical protein